MTIIPPCSPSRAQAALPYLTVLTAGSELVAVVRKMCDFTLDAVARRERGEVTTASQELGGQAPYYSSCAIVPSS